MECQMIVAIQAVVGDYAIVDFLIQIQSMVQTQPCCSMTILHVCLSKQPNVLTH